MQRRDFLRKGAAGGAALVIATGAGGVLLAYAGNDEAPSELAPNQWLRIDSDGQVRVVVDKSEMGQGVETSLPMIVAAELGADWSTVRVEHARPGTAFPDMGTAGSGSVSGSWRPLRAAAAAAREMLVAAAASTWGAGAGDCTTENGSVVHRPTGRRVAFGRLVEKAAALPVPQKPTPRPESELRLLGTRVANVHNGDIVRGRARYGIDARVPGMRFASIERSPRHGGKVQRFDGSRAMRAPGVVQVVPVSTGVAVVATSTWAAFSARKLLDIEWDASTGSTGDSASYARMLEEAVARGGKSARHVGGEIDAALAGAARRMESRYHAPFQAHAAMEPLSCVADVRADRCELWLGTQTPNAVQEAVSTLLGMPADRVTVNVMMLGGGFGRRIATDYAREAAEVSKAIGAPVQVVWTREDDVRHDMYNSSQLNVLTAGLDASGTPVAWRHRVGDFNLTMFGAFNAGFDPAADGDPWGGFDTPYAFPTLDVTLALAPSPVPTGAWRAVTYPAAVFARESFLDEVAAATGRDPLQLRLALVPSPGAITTGTRSLPNGDRLRAVLQLAADRAGWGTPLAPRQDGRRWGRGLACNSYHNRTLVAQVAEVSVGEEGDVRVHRVVCAVDCGRVINRAGLEAQFEGGVMWALSAALKTEVTFENGATRQSNYHDFPVLRLPEAPAIEVHVVESTLPPFGLGEMSVPAVAPAVGNAIFAATGKRVRRLPMRAAEIIA